MTKAIIYLFVLMHGHTHGPEACSDPMDLEEAQAKVRAMNLNIKLDLERYQRGYFEGAFIIPESNPDYKSARDKCERFEP